MTRDLRAQGLRRQGQAGRLEGGSNSPGPDSRGLVTRRELEHSTRELGSIDRIISRGVDGLYALREGVSEIAGFVSAPGSRGRRGAAAALLAGTVSLATVGALQVHDAVRDDSNKSFTDEVYKNAYAGENTGRENDVTTTRTEWTTDAFEGILTPEGVAKVKAAPREGSQERAELEAGFNALEAVGQQVDADITSLDSTAQGQFMANVQVAISTGLLDEDVIGPDLNATADNIKGLNIDDAFDAARGRFEGRSQEGAAPAPQAQRPSPGLDR